MPVDHDDPAVLLRVQGLTKSFAVTDPPTEVLRGIDLSIRSGEFLAIMGASGSGKSTALHTMSGMDRATSGTVEFDRRDLTGLTDRELSRIRLTRMGFVFQQAHFLPNLSLRDNILLPALTAAGPGHQVRDRVQVLLTRFGIAEVADHGMTQVSGGQLQRAALCRALATEPDILFADEPTGALNTRMTIEVLDALSEVHAAGTAVVMVTHDAECAARADRVVYLRDGRIADGIDQRHQGLPGSRQRHDALAGWLRDQGF